MPTALPPGWLPPEQFVSTLPHGLACAGLLFTDAAGRILALRSVRGPGQYVLPGGFLEPGEDLLGCARRETVEELGFLPAAARTGDPRLLVLAFSAPEPPWPWRLGAFFDGGTLTEHEIGRITLDPVEHDAFTLRTVEELTALADERRGLVLRAAAEAHRTGRTGYLTLPAS
ncbi:8-oxo-dGTP pyrophosphatase MutT (NUDIX family) [Kitasatospora gansuensis]|uniref:8-oxo-dGTP pyrophosphatase MutT (NUDIX family) n=1 Tax=Kitasatospora gansuensis TaxID=258050 RepID=A0A7W7SJM6_9ACTN|nr:NUDIX hydrolase [Kitasatospora gansuensis]MBB4951709.1 8-oxo-dGTP pyrophosphatase MutT (NUDIX family) [Kitasatospora gansuensis]